MKKETLKTKKTYTEQLANCNTWQEVLNMKDPDTDRSNYLVLADPSWIESFSNEDALWTDNEVIDDDEEMISDYDILLREIGIILEPDEYKVYLLDAEENGSLRWIAKKIGRSHEWTRTKLNTAKNKLRASLSEKWRK